MAVEFVPIDRDTPYMFPPSVQDYLPDDHLARFVVEIVDQLDLNHLSAVYTGRGSKPFHPAMLVSLLFYGYATGVFPLASWRRPVMIRLRFVMCAPTAIRTMTRSTVSGNGFCRSFRPCLRRFWWWPRRWGW